MITQQFTFQELEYFLKLAKEIAGIKADMCYKHDCEEKRKYLNRTTEKIYNLYVGIQV